MWTISPWPPRSILTGPPVLAFLPALTLAAYWIAGEPALNAAGGVGKGAVDFHGKVLTQ